MVLTSSSRTNHHDNKFPTFQLFVLAICRIAEPIALTSIFPYAYPMVKRLLAGDEKNAALYAGTLISSFALAEALTGVAWGSLSDRVGRKPVLLLGCFGTMLSLLLMGFATNFWLALLARLLGGLLNGNIGVIQTMVGELVRNPEHEPRAFAVMPFVWSVGSILGPAISGLTVGSPLLPSYPYLLPNLICAGMLLVSIAAGYLFLEETLQQEDVFDDKDESPLMLSSGAMDQPGVDLRTESYGTFNRVDIQEQSENWNVNSDGSPLKPSTLSCSRENVLSSRVIMLIVGLSIYLYHNMSYDHLLPIFLQDDKAPDFTTFNAAAFDIPGGLGLSTQQVGVIMSVMGIIALFIQGVVFPLLAERLGVWRTFQMVTILHPVAYFIPPYVALLPQRYVFPGIYLCLLVRSLFTIPAYPLFLILIKEAGNPKYMGKINGLAASCGAVARTMSPPITGLLYGIGAGVGFTGMAWWGSGVVAMVGAAQIYWILPQSSKVSTLRLPCSGNPESRPKDTVHINVCEVDEV